MLRLTTFFSLIIITNVLCGDVTDFIEDDIVPVVDGVYDLEKEYSSFVLETKKIEIPEYPGSFNPSIIRWRGGLLMSFRIRDAERVNEVGLVWVDEEMNPLGKSTKLRIEPSSDTSLLQDPRLIAIGDRLYFVYSDIVSQEGKKNLRRVFVGNLELEEETFVLRNAHPLTSFEKENRNRAEKNWSPFIFEDQLLLSYAPSPHRILCPFPEEQRCETVCMADQEIRWEFGDFRGGTPALKENGFYLSFFHSAKKVASIQSDKKMMLHYFMGAYIFEDRPPFSLKAISRSPILGEGFYTKTSFKTWKPLKVVFPCGYVSSSDYIWIVYGKQDSELWAVKIDKQQLLKSLMPIDE